MIAYDHCKNSSAAGVVYSEIRFNPTYLMRSELADDKGTLTNEQVMDAVLSGLEKGQKVFGIKVNVIVTFITNVPGRYILTSLPIGYGVIVALTGLPIRCNVIITLNILQYR